MNKRDVITKVLIGDRPPYTPWSFKFTVEPQKVLKEYFGAEDLDIPLNNHILNLGSDIGFFEEIEKDYFKDVFGVVWDRRVDKDIGVPANIVLKEPHLDAYSLPDPLDCRFYRGIEEAITRKSDMFRVFQLGFSLFERAWTLRGMENLLMDFFIYPDFVRKLFNRIADYNIEQVREACKYDIDAIYFGDDWGQQTGLIMGAKLWHEFILPPLKRMYDAVKKEDRFIMIHSCGKVDELFPSLIDAGIDCFNPFQPEVMDVYDLHSKYQDKLSFHGGLSIQKTLPYGNIGDVKKESEKLLHMGLKGGYIFSPSHAVEGDAPIENILEFIKCAQNQL